jgi:elongator complex protein 1
LRQHKIDINLIYDVNPEHFLANIEKFVKEVSQVDYLNLFVNSLSKESRGKELDFMLPLSKEDLVRREHELMIQKFAVTKAAQNDKINKICDALK